MLILHKRDILDKIREELKTQDENLREIILYGSVSRSEHTPTSDIDLVLITTNIPGTKEIFQSIRTTIFLTYSVPVTALYLTPDIFSTSIDPFIATVKREGIILWKKNQT